MLKKIKSLSVKKHRLFTITIVGSGNVAWHLAHTFATKKHQILTIISRNEVTGKKLAKETGAAYTNNFNINNSASDFVLLAVNDSCLTEVLEKIETEKTILLHTSGSIGIDLFKDKAKEYGVFYPYQTLTKGIETDITNVPICVEASNEILLELLFILAESISKKVYSLNSEKRRILHLAGVLSNNFINHLIARTFDYLDNNEIDKELLFPLLEETLNKLKKTTPGNAQTGPARRKNIEIIKAHTKMLEKEPVLKNLYSLISDSIIAYYS
jgi:predicted short-subunit dehydrogenase-like oxidoreductase (DUF2520 family)